MRYDFTQTRDSHPDRMFAALGFSVLVHIILLVGLGRSVLFSGESDPFEQPISSSETRFMAVVEPATAEEPDEDDAEDDEQTQHVSQLPPPPDEEERPDDASFADRFDRRVEEETFDANAILADRTLPQIEQVGASTPSPSAAQFGQEVAAAERTSAPEQAPVTERQMAPNPDGPSESGPDDATRDDAPFAPTLERAQGSPLALSEDGSPEGGELTDYLPTLANAGSIALPAMQRADHIEVEEGDRTALNSYRSLYWSFFNRMQQRLYDEWNPLPVLQRNDPTGALYGRTDRYTQLQVTLNSDGSLRHAVVERTSELDFLDDEAIRAFQAAAPFPNVPEAMKDDNGHATFTYGFYVNFSTRSSRIRRIDRF